MSWLFSEALGAECLAATCSGGEQFAQLNVMPTQQQFWRNDKTTDFSDRSLFGLTCAVLTADRGADLLAWCREDFLARTYQSQEAAQDSTENVADCGESLRGLLARYDRDSHSLKTAQCSLLEDSTACYATLPRSGTMRSGAVYQRDKLEPRMSVTAFGYSLPTPTVCGNYNRKGASKTSGDGLATYVKKFPTPCASDNRDRGGPSTPEISRRIQKGKQVMLSMTVDGQMNPAWVEWLMGWPIGWTELKPLETDKFQEWQQQHSLNYASAQDGNA